MSDTGNGQLTWPLFKLWVKPRRGMHTLIAKRSVLPALIFASASGVANAFSFVQTSELDDSVADVGTKLALTIGGGVVTGVLFLLLLSLLFMFFGRWLGGKGTYRDLLIAVGWAMLPFVGTLVTSIVELNLYGDAFLIGGDALVQAQAAHPVADIVILLLNVLFSVYALVFLVAGLAEAHSLRTSQGAGVLGIFFILYLVLWIAVQAVALGM